jgi:HSP20 family protein
MEIMKWDPWRELQDMSDRLEQIMSEPGTTLLDGREGMTLADWVPTVDLSETESD